MMHLKEATYKGSGVMGSPGLGSISVPAPSHKMDLDVLADANKYEFCKPKLL